MRQPKVLSRNEKVIAACQPHLMHVLVETREFWGALLALALLVFTLIRYREYALIAIALLGVAVLALVPTLMNRRVHWLYITSQRLLIESGLIGRDYQSFPFSQISEITVDVDAWGKLLGSGTVHVRTAAREFTIRHVPQPYTFVSRLHAVMNDVDLP